MHNMFKAGSNREQTQYWQLQQTIGDVLLRQNRGRKEDIFVVHHADNHKFLALQHQIGLRYKSITIFRQ